MNDGQNRLNYVIQDKRFKTTLFSSNIKKIKNLLNHLFSLIDDPFDLSLTVNRDRQNITKRQKPLRSIQPNLVNYKTIFPQKLFKIVWLINGLNSPILLAKN